MCEICTEQIQPREPVKTAQTTSIYDISIDITSWNNKHRWALFGAMCTVVERVDFAILGPSRKLLCVRSGLSRPSSVSARTNHHHHHQHGQYQVMSSTILLRLDCRT